MTRILIPILIIAGFVLYMRWQAKGGSALLRRQARPLMNDQLEALFSRLARAAGIDRVEVLVLPDRNPNGLATASGDIYITQGFIDAFRRGEVTAPELASVAAHELGHLALGHTKRRMIQMGGRQAAHLLLGGILSRVIPFVGAYISAWILDLITAKLSRVDEFEADAYATALMVRSGIGAEPQAALLEKLPALLPGMEVTKASWLASHPPADERAAAIRENAGRWRDHAPELER